MPAYARTALFQLVARIRFVLRPAMLAQFDKSQCFSFPDKPAQVQRFFAFIAPGYAGASDHDKSILQFFIKRLDILAPVMPSIDS